MSEQDKTKDSKKKYNNIFIANSIYPEVNSIFEINQNLEEIKDDCYIILDTNVLLLPYKTGKESLNQIKQIYKKFIDEYRLIIPGQVAREFVKNRPYKIVDLYESLTRKKNRESFTNAGSYPLLESLEEYQQVKELEKILEKKLDEYKKKIDKLLQHIQNWTWNDPVSLMYGELFTDDVILDLEIDKEVLKEDLLNRQAHDIPPGYKDASKLDSGIGDLLIWYCILEVGKKYKKSVFFVSGDKKPDWRYNANGNHALYPRYELVDEFRRYSEGQVFHIIELSDFLKFYGANQDVIKEVKKEENLHNISLKQNLLNIANENSDIYIKNINSDLDRTSLKFKQILEIHLDTLQKNWAVTKFSIDYNDFTELGRLTLFKYDSALAWLASNFGRDMVQQILHIEDCLRRANKTIKILQGLLKEEYNASIHKHLENSINKLHSILNVLNLQLPNVYSNIYSLE